MDIKDLIENLDPKNAGQIKALQEALQAKGYNVTPDGKMGDKTSQAISKWRDDQANAQTNKLKERELEDQAADRSWQNQAIQAAKWSTIPLGIGYGASQANKIEQRQLKTQDAQLSGKLPNAPMGWSSPRRFASRFAPYLGKGALYGAEGLALRELVPQHIESKTGQEFARAGGTGLIGASVGMLSGGLVNSFTPQVPATPGGGPALPSSPMGAPQLAQSPAPVAPTAPPPPATPPSQPPSSFKTGVEARQYAQSKGITLPSKISAAEAKARAEEIKAAADKAQQGSRAGRLAKGAKAVLPLAAGALAYDAASSEAEAAGATPGEAQQKGIVQGGAAAGGTAAGAYGLTKVLEKFPTLGKAVSGAGAMMAPMMAADAYDPTPEKLAMDRNELARLLPEWLQLGAIGKARDMAQVPERNPRRLPPSPMGFGGPY